jgi:hypothetical protein
LQLKDFSCVYFSGGWGNSNPTPVFLRFLRVKLYDV